MSRKDKVNAAVTFYWESEDRALINGRGLVYHASDKRQLVRMLEDAQLDATGFVHALGFFTESDWSGYNKHQSRVRTILEQVTREREDTTYEIPEASGKLQDAPRTRTKNAGNTVIPAVAPGLHPHQRAIMEMAKQTVPTPGVSLREGLEAKLQQMRDQFDQHQLVRDAAEEAVRKASSAMLDLDHGIRAMEKAIKLV